MAQLIELARRPVDDRDPPSIATGTVDEWGRDARLVDSISSLLQLRWNVSVSGAHHLPRRAGALLITNQRRLSLSPLYVSWALGRATGRTVRFVGRPDTAPLGPVLRRMGAMLSDPAEVRGALRHGELVVVGAASTRHPRHAGAVDHEMVAAAVLAGVTVVPVASMSAMFGRSARVEVGSPIRQRRNRRGPLAEVEIAETVQRHLQRMLDEPDGMHSGMHTGAAPLDFVAEG